MSMPMTLLATAVYVVLGRFLMNLQSSRRDVAFGILNVLAVYLIFFWESDPQLRVFRTSLYLAYLLMVVVQYLVFIALGRRGGWLTWVAFFTPIAFLILVRYADVSNWFLFLIPKNHDVFERHPPPALNAAFVGISYLAFRTSLLVIEVRNGVVPTPGFWRYLGFAFFLPTLSVGPISPYSIYIRSFTDQGLSKPAIGRSLSRMIVGAVKYRFLGPLLNQLTYSGLLLDGHPHGLIDLPVAAVAYYLYLYCNFSGFCDIAIGTAGLMGIPVAENFDDPLSARNLKDFWNRWHITLSQYMRDIVFTPLSKFLVRIMGPARVNEAIAITIMVVFLLVGIWHGVGWHYAAYGIAHGIGLSVHHYYTIGLKRRLGKEGFAAYNSSPTIRILATVLTFTYVTVCIFFFANDGESMREIFSKLRTY